MIRGNDGWCYEPKIKASKRPKDQEDGDQRISFNRSLMRGP